MKADASYNDLVGTVAADITDHGTTSNQLSEYVEKYGIDKSEYKAIGISYYNGYNEESGNVDFDLILQDQNNKDRLVKKRLEIPIGDFFDFFKRLSIVMMEKHFDHEGIHQDQLDRIDDDDN